MAAARGVVEAYDGLALISNEGGDGEKWLEWALQAAELGHSDTQLDVGNHYINNGQVDDAIVWLTKAAAQKNSKAACPLVKCLSKVGKDVDAPLMALLMKAASSVEADEEERQAAQLQVALHGEPKERRLRLTKLAQQGALRHRYAQYELGQLLYDGGNGDEAQKKEARKWYRRAGEQGLGAASHNVGVLYQWAGDLPRANKW